MKKTEREAVKKYGQYQKALKNIQEDKFAVEETAYILEKMDELWPRLPKSEQKKAERNHPLCKIVLELARITTARIEKSVLKWKMAKVFSQYFFETEYKGKIYKFDGRHFYVYSTGHELLPGIQIGDKKGPDLLINVKINVLPEEFAALWRAICGQHEKEIRKYKEEEDRSREDYELERLHERGRVLRLTEGVLKDFEKK